MEADAVSRAGLPFLRSVVATVRRRISDGIVFNFFCLDCFLSRISERAVLIFGLVYCLPF